MTISPKSLNKSIYSAYDQHIACDLNCPPEEDKTKQSFGDECDINNILTRFAVTGLVEQGNSTPPSYGVASAFDFQEAQNIILIAESMFNALPATVRAKFNNNPHTMLAWMDDDNNAIEAASLGLLPAAEALSEGSTSLKAEVASASLLGQIPVITEKAPLQVPL